MICNYFFPCLVGYLSSFIADAHGSEAIIGGQIATDNQFPYQVSVQINHENECGGAILDEYHILTAAHCVVDEWLDNELFNALSIVAGTSNLDNFGTTGVRIAVEKFYFPTDYNENSTISNGDIAVLKLKQPLSLSSPVHFRRVKLPKNQNENFNGKTAKIAGFGWTWKREIDNESIGDNHDSRLRFAHASVVPCIHSTTREKHICAKLNLHSHSDTIGTSRGDSGSVLVDDEGIAIGILSAGPKSCVEKDCPAIYTRVSHYLTFIRNAKIGKKTKNMREVITSN